MDYFVNKMLPVIVSVTIAGIFLYGFTVVGYHLYLGT